jgi:hypothetical protein
MRLLAMAGVTLLLAQVEATQAQRPPVIDVHVHSGQDPRAVLARHDSLNVRFAVVSALQSDLRAWSDADTARFALGLLFPCERGRMPNSGVTCFESGADFPDTTWLRTEVRAGRVRVLGELVPEYVGMTPNDPRLEPYWQLAEEFDLPVAIHMGPGPPAAAYESSPVPYKSPEFRMAAGDPLLLEEVLLRHKRVRVYVMHAGWPRLESMLALLYAHPNVYVDVAVLQFDVVMPKPAYLRYLRSLVESGFGKRIMFGSDFANLQALGIDIILEAEFLTAEQKADILCNNAARFLRLHPGICKP